MYEALQFGGRLATGFLGGVQIATHVNKLLETHFVLLVPTFSYLFLFVSYLFLPLSFQLSRLPLPSLPSPTLSLLVPTFPYLFILLHTSGTSAKKYEQV